ncbi:MAG: DUF115 domain-containing protein [Clostridiales bacterium]|nr:DUF115 domain-containing protein [Clostridiales bacterium]
MDRQKLRSIIRTNKFIRVITFPLERTRREMAYRRYLKSSDSKIIKSMQRMHEGKRCFVIGNGPSLSPSDLERIKNEITFAANRIYNIFPMTSWRPTYYVYVDKYTLPEDIKTIKENVKCEKFIISSGERYGRTEDDKINYISYNAQFFLNSFSGKINNPKSMSEDISKHVTRMRTVTANEIEIAMYMGFKEIYLLGVDHNYRYRLEADGKIHDDPTVESSYFQGMKDAKGNRNDGSLSIMNVEGNEAAFRLCKKTAESKGVRIFNATRGGKLEIFERVDFDTIEGI